MANLKLHVHSTNATVIKVEGQPDVDSSSFIGTINGCSVTISCSEDDANELIDGMNYTITVGAPDPVAAIPQPAQGDPSDEQPDDQE